MAKTQLETACSPQKLEGAEGERRTRTPIKQTINPSMALSGLSPTQRHPEAPGKKLETVFPVSGRRFRAFRVSCLSAEADRGDRGILEPLFCALLLPARFRLLGSLLPTSWLPRDGPADFTTTSTSGSPSARSRSWSCQLGKPSPPSLPCQVEACSPPPPFPSSPPLHPSTGFSSFKNQQINSTTHYSDFSV